MMADGRRVFVLMPFEAGLDAVYKNLIKSVFEGAGFKVLRADDISSQQNILKDIVTSIRDADFIVADLTGSNENVYYELGLAHALRKRVVLMSQDVSKVPFDLRSYRILEYGTKFDKFPDAKARLTEHARKMADNELPFGSPFSDFGPLYDSGQEDTAENEEPAVVLAMSREAREIIKAAVAGNGTVMNLRHGGTPGVTVQGGDRSLVPDGAHNRIAMAWVAGVEELEASGHIRDTSGQGEVFEVTHSGYAAADGLYEGMTTQRRVWMELNEGEDARGSRPIDDKALETIAGHGGVRCNTGWRFPDGSVLQMRGIYLSHHRIPWVRRTAEEASTADPCGRRRWRSVCLLPQGPIP